MVTIDTFELLAITGGNKACMHSISGILYIICLQGDTINVRESPGTSGSVPECMGLGNMKSLIS